MCSWHPKRQCGWVWFQVDAEGTGDPVELDEAPGLPRHPIRLGP